MKAEPVFEFARVAQGFDRMGLRWLIIGGQAVRLYGSERLSVDYDVWIDPAERVRALTFLRDALGYELTAAPEEPKPIVKALVGHDRLDLFLVRALTNLDGLELRFDDVYARSRTVRDEEDRLDVRVPDLDDLIALKRMRELPRDHEDVGWLRVRRDLERKGRV